VLGFPPRRTFPAADKGIRQYVQNAETLSSAETANFVEIVLSTIYVLKLLPFYFHLFLLFGRTCPRVADLL
jgi:hypothetical protein